MAIWGKIIGGVAGFAVGGPLGAMAGAALGHAAESGGLGDLGGQLGANLRMAVQGATQGGIAGLNPARLAALVGGRQQVFALSSIVLSAKLAKVDGPVTRAEIDAFKRGFRIPPEQVEGVGRLFDQARDSPEGFGAYSAQLGQAFADNRGMLEDVLAALFAIARADGPVNLKEDAFLQRVAADFGLGAQAWDRARGATQGRHAAAGEEDPYAVLGVERTADEATLRATWKHLMRENHPDSLASRGVPREFIARAGDKVARINAAWDRIKRDRGF